MVMGSEWFNRIRGNWESSRFDQDPVSVKGVKIIIDETTGKLNPGQAELNEMIGRIHKAGQQAVVHAIEDTAIEAALTAFEKTLTRNPGKHHRHRIEHCSVCPPALRKKMALLGIMVVTHPAFVYYNGDRYLKTVPNYQMEFLYPLSELMKEGVTVAAASDGPLVKPDPISGIYGAVTRRSQTGKVVPGGEGISVPDALGLYTHMAAKAGNEENIKGKISKGKLADVVVLSADPLTTGPHKIKDIEVEMTVIGGKMVWQKWQGFQI